MTRSGHVQPQQNKPGHDQSGANLLRWRSRTVRDRKLHTSSVDDVLARCAPYERSLLSVRHFRPHLSGGWCCEESVSLFAADVRTARSVPDLIQLMSLIRTRLENERQNVKWDHYRNEPRTLDETPLSPNRIGMVLTMIDPKGLLLDLWSAKRVAKELDVSTRHVLDLLRTGRLEGQKIGKTWYTLPCAVEDYVRGRVPPTPNRRAHAHAATLFLFSRVALGEIALLARKAWRETEAHALHTGHVCGAPHARVLLLSDLEGARNANDVEHGVQFDPYPGLMQPPALVVFSFVGARRIAEDWPAALDKARRSLIS